MSNDFDLVIYGGTGDLSRKKLIPALFSGFLAGQLSAGSRIFLTSRKAPSEDTPSWLNGVLADNPPSLSFEPGDVDAFACNVSILSASMSELDKGLETLSHALANNANRPIIHFLATPPSTFVNICQLLGQKNLNGPQSRVILEKPLGHDLKSAQKINADVGRHFHEDQTYRIDHYLGKEAVQNLMALRFSNILFERLWTSQTIDHVQITIAEDLGLKGRGAYYEGIGAMRDMVQNHILQLLCLIAMEPPANLDATGIREEKLKVLKSLRAIDSKELADHVVFGQYEAGASNGQAVGGYSDDLELTNASATETYVAIKAHIDNWRWASVPFYLRTGKRLPDRFAEIVIQFKGIPHTAHPDWRGRIHPNRFIIRLQPEDHLAMRMMVKNHSLDDGSLKEVELNLDTTDTQRLGPYLRLILAAANNDQSLFVHRDEVEAAWRWTDGILNQWSLSGTPPIPYSAGTWGPYEAHDLMRQDDRKWFHDSKVTG